MWTARRILILIGGLLITLGGYAAYALFLGGIDGVPPLPPEYLSNPNDTDFPEGGATGDAAKYLEMGFGAGCEETKWPLQLWLPGKQIVFATGGFKIDEATGRVRLTPFSAAVFHKSKGAGGFPEISTIECDVAYLTLEKAATHPSDLNRSEIIAVEMLGKPGREIKITSNRGTEVKSDDIDVYINNGSLFYEKRTNVISTDGNVKLKDSKTQPPTEIRGNGMDLFLTKAPDPRQPAANPKNAKPRNDGNIDRILIRSDVQMHFWVDARAGFLGGAPATKNAPPLPATGPRADDKTPPNKAHIHIKTRGKFDYDLIKEFARFESPSPQEGKPDILSPDKDQVHVTRLQLVDGQERFDQLICDRLDLQFRKSLAGGGDNGTGSDKEIETATAVRLGTKDITLVIAAETIFAEGREMFYRAGDASNGPLTMIKGDVDRPILAIKSGHKIICPELHLFAANRAGEGQRAWAKGPGKIWLLDTKSPAKEDSFPTTLTWRDLLTVVREKEGGQVFDLLTVVGDAHFIDKMEDGKTQELQGAKIQAWIKQIQESADKPLATGAGKQELHRVVAQDGVHGKTPGFIIRRCNLFTMSFPPETKQKGRLPIFAAEEPVTNVVKSGPAGVPIVPMVAGPANPEKKVPVEQKKEKAAPPIELEGNEITMVIATTGTKKDLQEMIAKGNVLVFQPGDKLGEKRLDIRGQLLTVKETAPECHTMTVYGDKQQDKQTLARLEMGEMILWGPLVVIDQEHNTVTVDGAGAMQLPSNKNLDGGDLPKERLGRRVTIYWNKNMNFDGRLATFFGGIQAFQEGAYSYLKCDDMTVTLDRRISLKEGQKSDQNAKMDHIVCDRNVYVDDSKVKIDEAKGKDKTQLVQRNIIEGVNLRSDDDGPTFIRGPGRFRTLGLGGSGPAIGPGPANGSAKQTGWEQTRVDFGDQMVSTTKGSTRNAKFYGLNSRVVVYHFPTTDILANMDVEHPPKDGFYLQCDYLEVTGQENAGKTTQMMIAQGPNVYFKTDKYVGTANIITFNEHTDIITFEATEGNVVRMAEVFGTGTRPMNFNSRKVLYNRRTGEMKGDFQSISR